jgi:hypothetical protein
MVVAFAFHEHLAMEKLNEHYRSPRASARSETRAVLCKNCGLTFAVVLVNRDDEQNANYLDTLRDSIAADCINGLHRDEYTLNVGPRVDMA